jgi:hypothetical protein
MVAADKDMTGTENRAWVQSMSMLLPKSQTSTCVSALVQSMGQLIPQEQIDKAFATVSNLEKSLFHTKD